jgi:putative transposase
MRFISNEIYHIYNRGNNKQEIFFERENYLFFLKKIKDELLPVSDLLAYCLMPNHFHLLIRVKEVEGLNPEVLSSTMARKLGTLQSSYTRAINKVMNNTGSLFQQKAKSKNVESYGHICFHYIHQNPVKAGLCKRIEDWEFSSFQDYIGLRNGKLPSQSIAFDRIDIPSDRDVLYKHSLSSIKEDLLERIF